MPTVLDAYADQAQARPYIGSIAWFSVHKLTINHTVLGELVDEVGLDAKHMPKKPNDADVYRRVTSASQRKEPSPDEGVYFNLLVRPVAQNDKRILRKLVVETVDSQGERLDYSEAFDLIFHRDSLTVTAERLTQTRLPIADQAVLGILNDYQAARGTVDDSAVRSLLSRTLEGCHAVAVRETGGVFFVPAGHDRPVAALKLLAGRIGGVDFHALPLVNTDEQRDMVRAAATTEVIGDIEGALGELRGLLADDGKVSKAKAATLASAHRSMLAKVEAVEEVLEGDLAGIRARLTMLEHALNDALRTAA